MRLHLHLVSDSTGETVTTITRAAVSQFEDVVAVEHVWFFVRTGAQVDRVMTMVEALPGIVVYTLVSPDLREALEERCRALAVPCVSVLDPLISALSAVLGSRSRPQVGRQHVMDAGYFSRIEAMNFVLRHDDGQCAGELDAADVVLVGVSRTSKTPTCVYLANRGIKAANVPVGPDLPELVDFTKVTRPLIVGLTINPEQLVQIRRNRQRVLGVGEPGGRGGRYGGDYAELQRVRAELTHARRLFARFGWAVIDVTRRSVEETAAAIYQMAQSRRQPELRGLDGPPPGA